MSVPQPFFTDLANMGPLAQILPTGDFWIPQGFTKSPVSPWDRLSLGPISLPGVWNLEVDSSNDYENVKTPIKAGTPVTPPIYKSTLNDKGYNLAKLTAIGQIWQLSDWMILKAILPRIVPSGASPGNIRRLYAISHPASAILGISSVSITGCTLPPIAGQILTVRLQMVEWAQQTPQLPLVPGTSLAGVNFGVPSAPGAGAPL